jgi:hypothetical protein
VIKSIMSAMLAVALSSNAYAQTGPANARKPTPAQKLEPVLPAQPPQVSSGTKPSPVGQPIISRPGNPGYKPAPPKLRIKEPPVPR